MSDQKTKDKMENIDNWKVITMTPHQVLKEQANALEYGYILVSVKRLPDGWMQCHFIKPKYVAIC